MARTRSAPARPGGGPEADTAPRRRTSSPRARHAVRGGVIPMISQELKAPLSSIRAASQAVARARRGALSKRQERMLRIITEESAALVCLIEDLLDMAEIESGRLALRFRRCALAEPARASLERQRPGFRQKGVELLDSLPALCPPVRADAARLRQVFDHLLGNALRFTPPGGRVEVKVGLQAAPGPRSRARQSLLVTIADSGPGIARPDLAGLFDAARGESLRPARASGTSGLGLSFARFLVEAHGGEIWAESGPHPGAAIHFTLPIAR